MKILSTHDLQAIMQRAENALRLREQSNKKIAEKSCGLTIGTDHLQILVCGGTGCTASSGHLIAEHLQKALEQYNIVHQVEVITTGCFGFCEKGPIVKIIPDNTFYIRVTPEDVDEIITKHIINGHRVERLLYIDPKTERVVSDSKHMDFYRKQQRIALRNCGFINPENIEEYIARHGYLALADSLLHKQPIDVIGVIKRSGLRGRGGGGFPTGLKWESAHKQAADTKYVVCNADEGDPGAFMDRSIMEGDPHSIVEAMTICGYAIGSRQGLVYIRAEYPLAIQRLKTAIAQAREYGLLGERILGTDFCFDIEIRYGAGAFVCGEETALIHSMEGNRGEPTLKPPFPAEAGYLGKPTNVNNVETLANIPISVGLNVFTSVGVNLLTTIASGMTQGIPTFLGQALPMLTQFTESLRSNAGKLINAGLALIQNIAQGLINSIPVLIAYVPTIITNLAGIINDNAPKILATGVTIITNLAIGLVRAIPLLIANLPKIITAIVSIFTAFNWFSLGKNIVTGIIKGVKNLPSLLKTAAKNAVNGFKGAFKGNGILSAVKGAFTKIPSAVKSIFTKAVSLVKSFPGRFKNALKFSWSLPHLNLPHLSVSGGKAPFGIGGKGSLPSFHISWYKKAMESPYVFSDATLFGAGEAGDEMLYGRSRLMSDIKEATQGTKNDVTINVTVNGADNPEEWGRRMASELRRQVKMA